MFIFLLNYFNEKNTKNCGICDICLKNGKEVSEKEFQLIKNEIKKARTMILLLVLANNYSLLIELTSADLI